MKRVKLHAAGRFRSGDKIQAGFLLHSSSHQCLILLFAVLATSGSYQRFRSRHIFLISQISIAENHRSLLPPS